ncbi:MAG: ABC transporter permease [bacterium]
MFEILKNMWRRKTRTLLTVFGIAIGILALVVMGAIAEKLSLLVDGGAEYYKDKVEISAKISTYSSPLKIDKKKEIEKVDGVAYVAAETYSLLSDNITASLGPLANIISIDEKSNDYESFKIRLTSGRAITASDRNKALVGADLVKKLKAKVGENIKIRGKNFEVVGIAEKTFTLPDTQISVSLHDGREIMYNELPELLRNTTKPDDLVYGFIAYPKKGVDPNKLSEKIKKEVKGVDTLGPKQFQDQIASTMQTFNSIIYGICIISLLVGTLSIVNTMTMSISERTKEIGIKKALGAKNRNILLEYLTEAGVIGFFGGAIGIALGAVIVYLVNYYMEQTGDKIFLLTPRLLIGSMIFSLAIGVIAGIYPAYYAVKISIVKSLREE